MHTSEALSVARVNSSDDTKCDANSHILIRWLLVCFLVILCWPSDTRAQNLRFGEARIITSQLNRAQAVAAADLDGDGDIDVISASSTDNKIATYENLGGGVFGSQQVVAFRARSVRAVLAADIDGDGDLDIVSAPRNISGFAWHENNGYGEFPTTQIVGRVYGSILMSGSFHIIADDLDFDQDMDVATVSASGDIVWYPNLDGKATFIDGFTIGRGSRDDSPELVDVDMDGDVDVVYLDFYDDRIEWIENLGGGRFSIPRTVSVDVDGPLCLGAADLDGDGYSDVISSSFFDNKIQWYQNEGWGRFRLQQIVTTLNDLWRPAVDNCLHVADLDGDGDQDIIAQMQSGQVAWYENRGEGYFDHQQIIISGTGTVVSLTTADLDDDGDQDLLLADQSNDTISWYPNLGRSGPTNEDLSESIPQVNRLKQNFPNPFNRSTTIGISIARSSHVQLTVYDVIGRDIARLVDRVVTAGDHEVEFQFTSDHSGIFIYRLETDDFSQSKVMLLLR